MDDVNNHVNNVSLKYCDDVKDEQPDYIIVKNMVNTINGYIKYLICNNVS